MKRTIFNTIFILLLFGIIGFFGSASALAEYEWDDCPRGEINCEYPGKCRGYVDTNNDGICDRSQPAPQDGLDEALTENTNDNSDLIVQVIEIAGDEKIDDNIFVTIDSESSMDDTINIIAGSDDSEPTDDDATVGSIRLSYYAVPIVFIIGVLYGLSHLLSAKHVIKIVVHRRVWNITLLVSTIISALLGLILILGIDFGMDISLPFNSLFWHVEAGIAMGLIAMFHIAWHWRYFQKMLKPTS